VQIAAFDPGVTTGFCFLSPVGPKPPPTSFVRAQFQVELVWRTLDVYKPDAVVYEGFYWRQSKTKVDFTGVEVIGIIKEWGRQRDIDCYAQTPAEGKHYFDDQRLKERDMYVKRMPHANDATRHMLYFLEFGRGKNYV